MASKKILEFLFFSHLMDLKEIVPSVGDQSIFVCPICLIEFSTEDIRAKNLSTGHIWPEFIRELI